MPPAPTTSTREVAEPAELGLRPGQPRLHEGAADEVDAGLGVHPLGDAQRLLEHGVEGRADVAVALRPGEGAPHLAEDLRLADGHRVQARRDAEDVGDAALLVVDEEVRLEVGAVDRARRRPGPR